MRSLDEKEYFFNAVSSNPFFYFEKIDLNDPMYPSSKTNKDINIGTLDIETYLDEGEHKILCICLYNGIKPYSFYINDYNSLSDLLDSFVNTLFLPEFNGLTFYIHIPYGVEALSI